MLTNPITLATNPHFDHFIENPPVREFLDLVFIFDYAIVGGLAVAFWIPERTPTPEELDILIDEDEINDLLSLLEINHYTIEGWKGLEIINVAVRKKELSL